MRKSSIAVLTASMLLLSQTAALAAAAVCAADAGKPDYFRKITEIPPEGTMRAFHVMLCTVDSNTAGRAFSTQKFFDKPVTIGKILADPSSGPAAPAVIGTDGDKLTISPANPGYQVVKVHIKTGPKSTPDLFVMDVDIQPCHCP